MSISKTHFETDKSKRVPKKTLTPDGGYAWLPKNRKGYEKVERIIEEVACDIINGVPKSDIATKLKQSMYKSQEGKGIKDVQNQNAYYNAAVTRIQADLQESKEKNLAIMIGRMENLYKEAVEMSDRYGALNVLKEIAKIQGLMDNSKPQIQINNSDEQLVINFALNANND
jgi:pyruvate carboxylase